jgi:hypothetical protein
MGEWFMSGERHPYRRKEHRDREEFLKLLPLYEKFRVRDIWSDCEAERGEMAK